MAGRVSSYHKQCIVEFDPEDMKGHTMSASFGRPGGETFEKRSSARLIVDKNGNAHSNFTVDENFNGVVVCEFHGSDGGKAGPFTVEVK